MQLSHGRNNIVLGGMGCHVEHRDGEKMERDVAFYRCLYLSYRLLAGFVASESVEKSLCHLAPKPYSWGGHFPCPRATLPLVNDKIL